MTNEQVQKSLEERCRMTIVRNSEGKPSHFEIECDTKEDRDEMAIVFEQEAIIRVKLPAPVVEQSPGSEEATTEQK